jgi:hypothetical protein
MKCILSLLLALGAAMSGGSLSAKTHPPIALGGYSWPELPKDVWAVKPEDFPDKPGAVVLVDRYHFHLRSLERFRRVLVLAESGRSVAELQMVGARVEKLEGRTLTPEGKSLPFVQGGDVVRSVFLSGKQGNVEATKVIPPGVSNHCVVDVHWVEPIDESSRPFPDGYALNYLVPLSTTVPVKLAELMFDLNIADPGWIKKLLVPPGQKSKEQDEGGKTVIRFEDVPTRPIAPLASEGDLRTPVFNWFWSPDLRGWLTELGFPVERGFNSLDGAACTFFYEDLMHKVEDNYWLRMDLKALGKPVAALPAHAKAVALIKALRTKVKTIAELPGTPGRKEWEAFPDAVLKRGWGTSSQINKLAFHTLLENGLNVSLVMAIDREENRLIDVNNIWQYDHAMLLVQDEKGDPLFLNPGSTFMPLGIPAWEQGSKALVIHPGKKRLDWTGKIISLRNEAPSNNLQTWSATIALGEEEDGYTLAYQASGDPAGKWRYNYFEQKSTDPVKSLAPLIEREGFHLRTASSEGMKDPWGGVSFQATGVMEHESSRKRLITPFPHVRSPFSIPSSWPESRIFAIHFPMTTEIRAESRIAWKGAAPSEQELEPIVRENSLGKVAWSAEMSDGKELVVHLVIQVKTLVGVPAQYDQLKSFAGWIQEVLQRGISVPRS